MYMRRSHEMLSPDLTICHECLRPTNWHLPAWWVCHGSGWWVGSATQQREANTLHTMPWPTHMHTTSILTLPSSPSIVSIIYTNFIVTDRNFFRNFRNFKYFSNCTWINRSIKPVLYQIVTLK